jgi:hypothetical protein
MPFLRFSKRRRLAAVVAVAVVGGVDATSILDDLGSKGHLSSTGSTVVRFALVKNPARAVSHLRKASAARDPHTRRRRRPEQCPSIQTTHWNILLNPRRNTLVKLV